MMPQHSEEAVKEYLAEILSLHEKLFSGGGEKPLSLPDIETLDLSPLSLAQSRLDRFGPEALSSLAPEEQVLLLHLQEAIIRVLGPFAREDGPLAARIRALSGNGPLSAYRKAAKDGSALFERAMIGRL